ncbi:MAG: M28 family peptidase [Eubacteriales bacterium]
MTDISKEVFEKYQVRKTEAQKTKFIDFILSKFPEAKVEKGGFLNSRNIVVGDVDNAKIVLGAHYDTCSVLPIPNFIMPKNIALSLLYGLLIAIPVIIIAGAATFAVKALTDSILLAELTYFAVLIALFAILFAGKPNKHTANDNTSGVITLLEIMEAMSDDEKQKTAFVFFDNEENGLFGSMFFSKIHKDAMKDKLLLNFDCVSDGDEILIIPGKKIPETQKDLLCAAYHGADGKNVTVEKSAAGIYYPSDQRNFPCGIGVAAFKKGKFGLYLDRIHTVRDTAFDERNVELLCGCTAELVKNI